jgi:NTE family protein
MYTGSLRPRVTVMGAIGVVLGGGGITGGAFHAAVLAALEEAIGFDARSAAIIVGTSAGASTGAFVRAGLGGADLMARVTGEDPTPDVAEVLERYGPPIDVASMPKPEGLSWRRPAAPGRLLEALRRPRGSRVGTIAGALIAEGKAPTSIVSDRIDAMFDGRWPEEPLWACTVRLDDGARVVLRAPDPMIAGGATVGEAVAAARSVGEAVAASCSVGEAVAASCSVGEAVAASCAVPGWYKPVVVDGVRLVDGGLWSPTNADVLAGQPLDAVVVSSPMSGRGADAPTRRDGASRNFLGRYLWREVAMLKDHGIKTLVIEPSGEDMAVMGPDILDPTRRKPVSEQVRAGTLKRLQSGDLAARVRDLGLDRG